MLGYSRNFWALSFAMLMFMTSFNLIIPELNDFVSSLNGEKYKGLIISLFTITAGLSRPFSGKMADTIGRKSTLFIGAAVSTVITLMYPLTGTLFFFFTLRFLHGFSTGFFPTGATALVTDLLPINKRGQGMGVFGTAISLGIGIGQFLGSPITNFIGLNGLFVVSGLLSIVSFLLIATVRETLSNPEKFQLKVLKISMSDAYESKVLPAALVMFLTSACSGLIFVLSPDISGFLKIDNKGWFFLYYVISTIAVRLVAGKISDVIGRRKTLLIGIFILAISMILLAFIETVFWYTVASFIFGIATGINSPTLFAWTADLSPNHRRGIGAGTLFISLEFGILFGSASTLLLYNSTLSSIFPVFIFGFVLCLSSFIFVLINLIKHPERSAKLAE